MWSTLKCLSNLLKVQGQSQLWEDVATKKATFHVLICLASQADGILNRSSTKGKYTGEKAVFQVS